jgi:hypothetical protein
MQFGYRWVKVPNHEEKSPTMKNQNVKKSDSDRPGAVPADDLVLPSDVLMRLTGLTDRWLRQLGKRGYFPPPFDGKYLHDETLAGLFRYFREQRQGDPFREARTREANARAEMIELKQREAEGELIPLDKLREEIARTDGVVRQLVDALPAEMQDRCNPGDPELARLALDDWRLRFIAAVGANVRGKI